MKGCQLLEAVDHLMLTSKIFSECCRCENNRGEWEGRQVVPESWVELSRSPITPNINFYGLQWWLAPALEGFENSGIPSDLFLAWGIYTQQIFVIPSLDLVVVRVANDPGSAEWDEVQFLNLILGSIE